MKVLFERTFLRDLEKTRNKRIFRRVQKVIARARSADSADEVKNLDSMQDYESCYRVKLGEYRIGIQILKRKMIFVCLVHRKDLHRYFP